MSVTPRSFVLPEGLAAADAGARLAALARPGPVRRLDVAWLDSFDWRLHERGLRLELSAGEARWLDPEGGGLLATFAVRALPLRAADLPEFPGRERLAGLLDIRAAIEQARMRGRRRHFSCLDAEGKTVLRIELDEGMAVCPASGETRKLTPVVSLLPLRGYGEACAAMAAHLAGDVGLLPLAGDALAHVLAAFDRAPGDYSSRLDLEFSPRMSLGAAARMVHLAQIGMMERNIPGILGDIDSEFLHDFRVAVRRGRSALGQMKGALAPALERDMRDGLKRAGDRTTPLRDLDVFLLEVPAMRARLPAGMADTLAPFSGHLAGRRRDEHRRLARWLRSGSLAGMLGRWRGGLGRDDGPPSAALPLGPHADRRIWKLYKRLRRQGRAIDEMSPPAALHELRKTGKMLRYMIEFFASLYNREEIAAPVRDMKRLQDILGRFQDREVQADALRGFAHEMFDAGPAAVDTCLALGIVAGQLLDDRAAARAAFAERFADFDSARVHRRFRDLFRAGKGGGS